MTIHVIDPRLTECKPKLTTTWTLVMVKTPLIRIASNQQKSMECYSRQSMIIEKTSHSYIREELALRALCRCINLRTTYGPSCPTWAKVNFKLAHMAEQV